MSPPRFPFSLQSGEKVPKADEGLRISFRPSPFALSP